MTFSHRVLVSAVLCCALSHTALVAVAAETSTPPMATASIQALSTNDTPAKVWLSLGFGTSDERAPDWKWLRSQIDEGRVLDVVDNVKIAALVIPIFDDGRAFYDTQVAPFKGRNANAQADETALRSLLARAQAANVPVYLGVDVLGWQKNDERAQWPTTKNSGIFDRAPELQEINRDFATAPPRGTLYASPFNPKVRSAMTSLTKEIAQQFPTAQGVVFDVRLSREEIVGYSGAARVAAMKELKFDPLDLGLQGKADDVVDVRARRWITWRGAQITALVRDLSKAAKSQNAAHRVLASGLADYASQPDFNALRTGQDWNAWTKNKIVDGALLEGHWLPRYEDRATFDNRGDTFLVPLSNGGALSSESSFSRDWKSLRNADNNLDAFAVVARDDDGLRAFAALLRGEEIAPIAPAPQVGEIAPDWTLTDNVGKRWSARELRGQRAVTMLNVGVKATLTSEQLKVLGETSEKLRAQNIEPFVVSSTALKTSEGVTNLIDAAGEWLPSFGTGLSLLQIDRAGFVREHRVLDVATATREFASFVDTTPLLQEGQLAPDFAVIDMNGQMRRLSDLRGKKNLLLTFFPKCFTGGCTNHLTSIQAEKTAFHANDIEVLAVSIDAADVQIAFAQRWNLGFALVPDVGRNLSMLYGAAQSVDDLAARQSVLIDKNGIVRFIDRNVDIHSHGADMLKKMQSLRLTK